MRFSDRFAKSDTKFLEFLAHKPVWLVTLSGAATILTIFVVLTLFQFSVEKKYEDLSLGFLVVGWLIIVGFTNLNLGRAIDKSPLLLPGMCYFFGGFAIASLLLSFLPFADISDRFCCLFNSATSILIVILLIQKISGVVDETTLNNIRDFENPEQLPLGIQKGDIKVIEFARRLPIWACALSGLVFPLALLVMLDMISSYSGFLISFACVVALIPTMQFVGYIKKGVESQFVAKTASYAAGSMAFFTGISQLPQVKWPDQIPVAIGVLLLLVWQNYAIKTLANRMDFGEIL